MTKRIMVDRFVPESQLKQAEWPEQVLIHEFLTAYTQLRREHPGGDLHIKLFVDVKS